MIFIKDMRPGDVFVHRDNEELAWLVLEIELSDGVQGKLVHYRCLDLIDGTVQWASNDLSVIVHDVWEMHRS